MTTVPFTYQDYENARVRLVQEIHTHLTDTDKFFLISFKKGTPDWALFPLAVLKDLPAIQWKLSNIRKLIDLNPKKHTDQLKALQDKL